MPGTSPGTQRKTREETDSHVERNKLTVRFLLLSIGPD